MPLNPNQLQALLDAETENLPSGRYLADHTIFDANDGAGEPDDPSWLQILGDFAGYLQQNVMAFMNAGTLETAEMAWRKRMLNSQGFPPDVKVRYTYAAPGAYVPWTGEDNREIKQVVLHSFGQQWHAFKSGGKWLGKLNNTATRRVYRPYTEGEAEISESVWIPKGTDPAKGYAQWERFSSALRAVVSAPQPVTAVHYMIDRAGNLYVMADCNDILNSSGALSDTCVSIGLEEALYLPTTEEEATWLPGGTPPGTEGTVRHWDYSAYQYRTLAILIKKLQNGLPTLQTTTHTTGKTADASFTGYTMHGHIADSASDIVDVSPHFQEESDWDNFFALVEQQGHVDEFLTWTKKRPGVEGRLQWVEEIVSSLGPDVRGLTQGIMVNPSVNILTGILRTHQEINKSRGDYRTEAATRTANESIIQKQRQSIGVQLDVAQESPTVVPSSLEGDIEDITLEDSRSTGVDSEGLY